MSTTSIVATMVGVVALGIAIVIMAVIIFDVEGSDKE